MRLPFGVFRIVKKIQIFLLTKNRVLVFLVVILPLAMLDTIFDLLSISEEQNTKISLNPFAIIIGWSFIAFWMWTLATQINKVLPKPHQFRMDNTFRLLFISGTICSVIMILHYGLSIFFTEFINTYIDLVLYMVFGATILYIAWLTLNVVETYFTRLKYERGDFFTELLRLSFGFIFIFGLYPQINKLFRVRCCSLIG